MGHKSEIMHFMLSWINASTLETQMPVADILKEFQTTVQWTLNWVHIMNLDLISNKNINDKVYHNPYLNLPIIITIKIIILSMNGFFPWISTNDFACNNPI